MKKFYILFLAVFSNAIFEIAGDIVTDEEKEYITDNARDFLVKNDPEVVRLLELGFFKGKIPQQSPELDTIIARMMQVRSNVAMSLRESDRDIFIAKCKKLKHHLDEFDPPVRRELKGLERIIRYYLAYVLPASLDNEIA
mgnify:CR=1 FL=1